MLLVVLRYRSVVFFFQAEDGIRDHCVTGVQTCALPITESHQPFSWNDERGTGLGNLEVEGRWRFHDEGRDGWRAAGAAPGAPPTGTPPLDEGHAALRPPVVAGQRPGRPPHLLLPGRWV